MAGQGRGVVSGGRGRVRSLAAGRWSAVLENATVRRISWGGVEVLQGLEVSVRDRWWGTVMADVRSVRVTQSGTGLRVRCQAVHGGAEVGLDGEVTIELDASGRLDLAFRSVATRSFLRNRIGIVALVPMDVAGRPVTYRSDAGARPATFPRWIDPNVVATELTGLEWSVDDGLSANLDLSGERWEIEDQRNWTDPSFKVYPTPLRRPFPAEVTAGAVIEQRASLRLTGRARPRRTRGPRSVRIGPSIGRLPAIGSELPTDIPLDASITDAVRTIGLAHIRVHVREGPGGVGTISEAGRVARRLGSQLELELDVGANVPPDVVRAVEEVRPVEIFALDARQGLGFDSSTRVVEALRTALREGGLTVPVGGGTRANFTELNRLRPDAAGLESVTYAINPQVHAFDEASIVATVPVQGLTVRDARRLVSGRRLSVVASLRPRFNAAVADAPSVDDDGRPLRADPRQASVFAAAWALATIGALASSGVDRVTLGETHGPAGLVTAGPWGQEPGSGTRMAAVVCLLAACGGATLREVEVPPGMTGLAVDAGGESHLLVANMTALDITVGIPAALRMDGWFRLRSSLWHGSPARAWRRDNTVVLAGSLRLGPWGVARHVQAR